MLQNTTNLLKYRTYRMLYDGTSVHQYRSTCIPARYHTTKNCIRLEYSFFVQEKKMSMIAHAHLNVTLFCFVDDFCKAISF